MQWLPAQRLAVQLLLPFPAGAEPSNTHAGAHAHVLHVRAQMDAGALKAALARAAQQAGSDDDLDSDDGEGPSAAWRGADDMYDPGAEAEEEAAVLDADDEQALATFMAPSTSGEQQQASLGDVILAKLREKQAEAGIRPLPG